MAGFGGGAGGKKHLVQLTWIREVSVPLEFKVKMKTTQWDLSKSWCTTLGICNQNTKSSVCKATSLPCVKEAATKW